MTKKIKNGNGQSSGSLGEVVDLFCGVGALSHGLKRAGLKIVAGYDIDPKCKYAFETNNHADFHARDVSKLTAKEINSHFSERYPQFLLDVPRANHFPLTNKDMMKIRVGIWLVNLQN